MDAFELPFECLHTDCSIVLRHVVRGVCVVELGALVEIDVHTRVWTHEGELSVPATGLYQLKATHEAVWLIPARLV